MSKFLAFLGLLCFVGLFAYWYILPYQCFLALMGAGNLWGPIIGNLAALIVTCIIGVPITIALIFAGIVLTLAAFED